MYSYSWDSETGGLLLNSSPLQFSKEPRPVYYKELDILGFDQHWKYDRNDSYPYMWAEANSYFYRGRLVAKTKGGSLYTAPELIMLEEPEPNGAPLRFVDVPAMVEKNHDLLEKLVQDTIKKIYNTYMEYRNKVDVFYVAFSGGKDSVVAFDLVQRALPHNQMKVLFGDTGMEFPDTYRVMDLIKEKCEELGIEYLRASSKLNTEQTWRLFGPPAVTNRWCCSVHKTSPQIMLLQEQTGNQGFTGMAFTGIRGDESVSRSEYDDVNYGSKHRGQYSCHPILEWNSAELFDYIYQENLILNEAYKKGNTRAGCLVCPMSSGKHEYLKAQCYPAEVDRLVEKIKSTTGKSFSEEELVRFVDFIFSTSRKTGRELNFGQDKHLIETDKGKTVITVFNLNDRWKEWAKTIGEFIKLTDSDYTIDYKGKAYVVHFEQGQAGTIITFPNCGTAKDDIKFISLFRSVIIKSIYCVNCGVCAANCSTGCIDMSSGLTIGNACVHCYQCHDIHEHCLRYNSIRNRVGGEKKMKGMDRYFSFGIRKNWMDLFFQDEGLADFWMSDGHGLVANKKKDAFLNFVKDAGLVEYDKTLDGDKYTKNIPTTFARAAFSIGSDSDVSWALMLCNLAYTSEFNWFIKNIPALQQITPDQMKYMLSEVMEGDTKGLGKRNIADAFKILLVKTPFGSDLGLGHPNYEEKVNASGNEVITMTSFYRDSWSNPDPRVILYSLYKFAENCGDYYQFTLSRLLDHDVESYGVSPTEIFNLDRAVMEKLLNGLAINYPDFITAQFNLDLDTITLNADKTSADVLALF